MLTRILTVAELNMMLADTPFAGLGNELIRTVAEAVATLTGAAQHATSSLEITVGEPRVIVSIAVTIP